MEVRRTWLQLLLALTLCAAVAKASHETEPRVVEALLSELENYPAVEGATKSGLRRLLGVSWSNCGGDSDPVQLLSLSVSPDTVHLPGQLVVSASLRLLENLTAPIGVDVEVERKTLLGWFTIPCLDGVGSCDYGDACAFSPYSPSTSCPPSFQQLGLPCRCPISQGTYHLDSVAVAVHAQIPHWLEQGRYRAKVRLTEAGQQVACYRFESKLN